MASLIPGFEYDIFISYRQKDNKHDGWVTKFVENLKGELEATFKEDVSVYFDENPHDRLQETHNVDKSLEGKLKCLIFIPILSQTYCDPNSYAWQYEFMAFLRMAEQDRFGKDIKLRSGNVASRILPIRIHDLEPEDVKLFEKETESVLRALDFVFKTSTGVSRPLKASEDHPNDNINKTFYSDQINKVAHAIKEIILGMKAEPVPWVKDKSLSNEPLEEVRKEGKIDAQKKPAKLPNRKLLSGIGIIIILIILAVFALPKVFHTSKNKIAKDPNGKISIAVTNFDNNTNDTTLNWLKIGIPELLRNNLAGAKEFFVQNTQTMNELYGNIVQINNASVVPSLSREVAMKLKAGSYITGTFQKYGNQILTLVKLIDTKSDEVIWTGKTEGPVEMIKNLADSLSTQLKNFLEVKILKQKITPEYYIDINTNSPEALREYIKGMQLLMQGKCKQAVQSFEESYRLDTTFTLAAFYAAYSSDYGDNPDIITSQKWTKVTYRDRKNLPYDFQLWAAQWEAGLITRDCDSSLYYTDLLAQSDIKSRLFWNDIGATYIGLDRSDEAIKAFEKVEAINSEWGGDWKFLDYYKWAGWAYHKAGLHEKEAKIYDKGLRLFPENVALIWNQASCAILQKNDKLATELIDKLVRWGKVNSISESDIEIGLGRLYTEAKSFDKAEEHYRQAIKLMPHDKNGIASLAFFLVFNDRNIQEGIKLINSILASYPDDYVLLKAKGIGFYKQGKYKEAFEILKEYQGYKADCTYDPEAFGYLKKAKEALNH